MAKRKPDTVDRDRIEYLTRELHRVTTELQKAHEHAKVLEKRVVDLESRPVCALPCATLPGVFVSPPQVPNPSVVPSYTPPTWSQTTCGGH